MSEIKITRVKSSNNFAGKSPVETESETIDDYSQYSDDKGPASSDSRSGTPVTKKRTVVKNLALKTKDEEDKDNSDDMMIEISKKTTIKKIISRTTAINGVTQATEVEESIIRDSHKNDYPKLTNSSRRSEKGNTMDSNTSGRKDSNESFDSSTKKPNSNEKQKKDRQNTKDKNMPNNQEREIQSRSSRLNSPNKENKNHSKPSNDNVDINSKRKRKEEPPVKPERASLLYSKTSYQNDRINRPSRNTSPKNKERHENGKAKLMNGKMKNTEPERNKMRNEKSPSRRFFNSSPIRNLGKSELDSQNNKKPMFTNSNPKSRRTISPDRFSKSRSPTNYHNKKENVPCIVPETLTHSNNKRLIQSTMPYESRTKSPSHSRRAYSKSPDRTKIINDRLQRTHEEEPDNKKSKDQYSQVKKEDIANSYANKKYQEPQTSTDFTKSKRQSSTMKWIDPAKSEYLKYDLKDSRKDRHSTRKNGEKTTDTASMIVDSGGKRSKQLHKEIQQFVTKANMKEDLFEQRYLYNSNTNDHDYYDNCNKIGPTKFVDTYRSPLSKSYSSLNNIGKNRLSSTAYSYEKKGNDLSGRLSKLLNKFDVMEQQLRSTNNGFERCLDNVALTCGYGYCYGYHSAFHCCPRYCYPCGYRSRIHSPYDTNLYSFGMNKYLSRSYDNVGDDLADENYYNSLSSDDDNQYLEDQDYSQIGSMEPNRSHKDLHEKHINYLENKIENMKSSVNKLSNEDEFKCQYRAMERVLDSLYETIPA